MKPQPNYSFLLTTSILIVVTIVVASCITRQTRQATKHGNRHCYATGVPDNSEMERLQTIGLSVKKLSCYAEYTTWVFSRNSGIKPGSDFTALSALAVRVMRTPENVLGTATILSYSNGKVLAVTCAHVIDFPDTIYTYHEADITGEPLIYTASIKKSQINYVKEIPVAGGLTILATDRQSDLALLGGKLSEGLRLPPALNIKIGDSRSLSQGTRAWVFGFPIGYMMLTEAMVNNPGIDQLGSFMLDAVFNPGFSGGLTLAYNIAAERFEVIWLGRSAPSSPVLVLTPAGTPGIDRYPPLEPYTDKVFVRQRAELAYGLTFVSSSVALLKILTDNRENLINQGYDLSFLE